MSGLRGTPTIAEGSFEGANSVVLDAGGYTATFLPELGMLGVSLTFDGHEHLSLHGGIDAYRAHHTTGLPFLHPWANRLSKFRYEFEGTWVDFDATPPVTVHGDLPIHGTMTAAAGWTVEARIADSTRAMLQARYAFGDHPEQLRSFPFPHEVVLFIELSDLGLKVTTTVHATGDVDVPISFGWHPYFTIPGVSRRELEVILPDRDRLALDVTMIPNGNSTTEAASTTVLGDGALEKTFDDAYRLGDFPGDRILAIEGPAPEGTGRLRLEIELDELYPFAQVYAPSDQTFVALEPMTAPINALVSGDLRVVPPGESSSASFVVRVVPVPDPADAADLDELDVPDVPDEPSGPGALGEPEKQERSR